MTNKNDETTRGNIRAGITGAVIGAGIAAAATKIITDKKTQKLIKNKAAEVKQGMTDTVKTAGKQAKKIKEELMEEKK